MPNTNDLDPVLVQGYNDNIQIRFQQKQSKLLHTVQRESQEGEYDYYDRAGPAGEEQEKQGINVDTTYQDLPFNRRRIGCSPTFYAALIDKRQKLRMLSDPTSVYVVNAIATINRGIDRRIVNAFTAPAFAGKHGETQVNYDTTNDIAANYVESGSAAASNLTIGKLRRAHQLIRDQDQLEDDERVYFVACESQKTSLLRSIEVTSSDYNAVKALVHGEINTFLGFEFIWFAGNPNGYRAMLPKTGNIRTCYYYTDRAVMYANQGEELFTSVDVLPTKHFSAQVYVSQDSGAVRMWEEKIGRVFCDESA